MKNRNILEKGYKKFAICEGTKGSNNSGDPKNDSFHVVIAAKEEEKSNVRVRGKNESYIQYEGGLIKERGAATIQTLEVNRPGS